MRILVASMMVALGAGSAVAQIVPLGAPIMMPPKTYSAQPPSASTAPLQTGRLKAAAPLGSNYSPYSLQPQGSVTATAPSTVPYDKPVASGVVNDPNALAATPDVAPKPAKPADPQRMSDMQKLAPQAAERTQMQSADAPVPR